jgi:hypothetical protein
VIAHHPESQTIETLGFMNFRQVFFDLLVYLRCVEANAVARGVIAYHPESPPIRTLGFMSFRQVFLTY